MRRINQHQDDPDYDTKEKTLLVITPDYPDKDNRYIGSIFVKDHMGSLKPFFKEIVVICPVPFSFGIMANDRYVPITIMTMFPYSIPGVSLYPAFSRG